ncbi:M14 family zinc carboxypeptidase [Ramlibacter humi]|uniref:M14 family zinc carboxypeptidase n=1 Tax=Ramlibacter humi TaxID=2530451 RepID=UPI001EF14FA0|nr:M14 family zinc carboxypeptidase [Ramlibacter humi]
MPEHPRPPAELTVLERLLDGAPPGVEIRCTDCAGEPVLPVYEIALGTSSPQAPAVGFFGGVHGLERIGAQVVIAWLQSLLARLSWDDTLHRQLECVRLVFMPLVNPGGTLRHTRANPAGVDLMRNSPVEAKDRVAPMVGGQRLSAGLPWYRGRAGATMEPESAALCAVVERELHPRPFSLAIDCHSGFGLHDRLWFPFAHTARPIGHLAELEALHAILESSHPNHPYVFEPQSRQYLAHGDLWDHLYLRASPRTVFLPLTLEMGSWLWVKKNPRQLFSRSGIFNPMLAHRHERVLRRHFPLLEFLVRAAIGSARWLPAEAQRGALRHRALERWYRPS